jgi:uncharacterized membrane protein
MRSSSPNISQPLQPVQINSSLPAKTTDTPLEGIFVISLLLAYTLSAFWWRKYRAYRTATLQRQVETLERLWQIKPKK